MAKLEKGSSAPLNVTQQAKHRVFVGLGWNPKLKSGIIESAREMMGGPKTWHDLDLACFIYDEAGNFIESVAAAGNAADTSGRIYHSGDNTEGLGEGDDEQISVELKDLPPNIAHIVFRASIKSGHHFDDVDAPEIRIADGYSGHTFLEAPLGGPEGRDKSAYLFVRISRAGDGWHIHNIDEFPPVAEDADWAGIAAQYL